MIDVGFTGPRQGMTPAQANSAFRLLELAALGGPLILRHGDCTGADEQIHGFAHFTDWRIVIHPPDVDKHRAFCEGADEVKEPKPYLERNRDIVLGAGRDGGWLLATPAQDHEIRRSGTWATVRAARGLKVPCIIVWPSGGIQPDGEWVRL